MRIDERIATGKGPCFSFEFFPPKTEAGTRNLEEALSALSALDPTFVSVTYGAGGSPAEKVKTVDIVSHMKRDFGVENVLALRGDPPLGQSEWTATEGGLRYSRELVELIREEYDFAIGAACFPEVHIHATDAESDLRYTKEKVDAGAGFLITQLFYDNRCYYEFVERARDVGIDVPIIPGIMPITNAGQIRKITSMCGSDIPAQLQAELELRADDPAAATDFGVAYATLQCADLLANGAAGLLDVQRVSDARTPVDLPGHVDLIVLPVGADAPGAQEPAAEPELALL